MNFPPNNFSREILREVQRRAPTGRRLIQEAFTADHGRPVWVKLTALLPDTFYILDEYTSCAFRDALMEWAAHHGAGRLTVSCTAFGEFQAQRHRLQHLASRVERVRVLAVGTPERFMGDGPGMEVINTNGGILTKCRLAAKEGQSPALFIGREIKGQPADAVQYLSFFSCDPETVDEVIEDIDSVVQRHARTLPNFDRLQTLHQTTQRVARELDSYTRRMELAIDRARRRPDLLTPARFDRIVRQSILKMEELKEIPRRALRTLGKSHR